MKIFDEEKFDFVIFSGDQVNGEIVFDVQFVFFKIVVLLIKCKIFYVVIFGNYDDEGFMF